MSLPSRVSVNFARAHGNVNMEVQPQRWNSFQRRLLTLSRNGILNFMAARTAGSWTYTNPAHMHMSEEQLRRTFEGPLSASWIAIAPDVRYQLEARLAKWLGANHGILGSPSAWCDAVVATGQGQWAGDNPAVPLP